MRKKNRVTAVNLAASIIANELLRIDGKSDLTKLTEVIDCLYHTKLMLDDSFSRLNLANSEGEVIAVSTSELPDELRHTLLGIDALNNSEHRALIRSLLVAEGIDGCALYGLFGNEEDHKHQ